MSEKRRSKILVVDDDALNVRLIETQLKADYDIKAAYSGEEALGIINSEKPDLVILDVMMPGMNGYDVCRRIKSSKETCFIPVIIVTALSSKHDRLEGMEAGADDFLTKPIDRFEVLTRVRTLLKNKQLYDDLVTGSERTRRYLEIAGCMIVAINVDQTVTLANAKCCEVLGYSEEELIGSNWFSKVVPAGDKSRMESLFERIVENDLMPVESFEGHVLTKAGQKKLISWRNSYMKDPAGQITTFLSSGMDITEQRDAEQKIQLSEEKFRMLAENANDVIWTMDENGRFLYISPSVFKLRGYTPEEVLSQNMSEIFSADSIFRVRSAMNAFFADVNYARMIGHAEIMELEQFHKEGHIVWTEAIANPLFDENGDFKFFLGVTRDISERKRSQEAIQKYIDGMAKANESLQSLDRMKEEFISNLSHELKTPLISIKGYSELVHDELLGPLNEKQKNALRIVLDKYDHLSFLLDSLIYMSITRSGKVNYRFDPIRIEDALKKVMDYFLFKATDKQIKMVRNFENDLPLVKGDVEYIPYLFRSLLDNALKFSRKEGIIEVSAYRDNGYVHVVVKDNGIGIPKAEFSNIFHPFYQVDNSSTRKHGGSGLGLHVSKTITEVHNGDIWIESEEGVGTSVHVTFPSYSPTRMESPG